MQRPDEKTIAMARVARSASRLAKRFDMALGRISEPIGITVAQFRMMAMLRSESGLTVPEIARRIDVSRQAIQRIANDLQEAGLVRFADNPAHKRAPLIQLTEGGRVVLGQVFIAFGEWAGSALSSAETNDLSALAEGLEGLLAMLGEQTPKG